MCVSPFFSGYDNACYNCAVAVKLLPFFGYVECYVKGIVVIHCNSYIRLRKHRNGIRILRKRTHNFGCLALEFYCYIAVRIDAVSGKYIAQSIFGSCSLTCSIYSLSCKVGNGMDCIASLDYVQNTECIYSCYDNAAFCFIVENACKVTWNAGNIKLAFYKTCGDFRCFTEYLKIVIVIGSIIFIVFHNFHKSYSCRSGHDCNIDISTVFIRTG